MDPIATEASSTRRAGRDSARRDLDRPRIADARGRAAGRALIGHNVPTQEELAEIEPSSRLFERDGALYMTLSALRGVNDGQPTTTPIGFVLAGNGWSRCAMRAQAGVVFADHVRREPELRAMR